MSAPALIRDWSGHASGVRVHSTSKVVEWVRDHPWSDESAIRAGVGRASRMHGELTDLEGKGALIRCSEFDARVGRDVWLFALPDTPPPAAGDIRETPQTTPSNTPFADLDRALALLTQYEQTLAEQQIEIGMLRAERDEVRQTLALLKLPLVAAKVTRHSLPLPATTCIDCPSQFLPKRKDSVRCPTCYRQHRLNVQKTYLRSRKAKYS